MRKKLKISVFFRMSLKEDLKESQDQAERYKMKMAEQNSVGNIFAFVEC